MAVVITTGEELIERCVLVAARSTGAQVLIEAIGLDQIRLGAGTKSEFVCGLLGVPETGCVTSGADPYWSYWTGVPGGTWSYASVGFTSAVVSGPCAVQGWRYGVGAVPPTDVAPEVDCG